MENFFLDALKKQGFTTILLLLIAWLLYNKMEHIEAQLRDCEAEKMQIVSNLVATSNEVISKNSAALERNAEVFETIFSTTPTIHRKRIPLTARGGVSGFPSDK